MNGIIFDYQHTHQRSSLSSADERPSRRRFAAGTTSYGIRMGYERIMRVRCRAKQRARPRPRSWRFAFVALPRATGRYGANGPAGPLWAFHGALSIGMLMVAGLHRAACVSVVRMESAASRSRFLGKRLRPEHSRAIFFRSERSADAVVVGEPKAGRIFA